MNFKLKKMIFVFERKLVSFINYINANKYTKIYSNLLINMGMKIEKYPRYIDPSVWFDGTGYAIISIGKDSVLSKDVVILTHDYSIARGMQAIGKLDPNNEKDTLFLKEVSIGKNCFIGARSIIMPGTIIGDNCIIGAGSVVKGKIYENTIIAGNPAKKIGNTLEWANIKKEIAIRET